MGIVIKVLGTLFKYDKSLPYTYMIKVTIVEGNDELANYYFAESLKVITKKPWMIATKDMKLIVIALLTIEAIKLFSLIFYSLSQNHYLLVG